MDVDSCRLIALNFMGVVENPFTDNAYVDYDKLYEVAYEQQVLLDNLVDLEIEKIDRILEKIENDPEASKYKRIEYETWQDLKDSAKKYRRTGGGFTALGDLLAAIGVEYGTPEANEVVDKLMSTKLQGEWDASIDLSIQRGSFPEWDDQYDSTEFFDMLAQEFPEIYARNNKYGRRNISLSTVAPTGSVSLLANINGEYGTTSGIEPVFSTTENKPWHTRRRRITEDEDLEPEGVDDSGFPYVTYNVFHEGFKQWVEEQMHENGTHDSVEDIPDEKLKDLAKLSPYVTSAGLNYRQRIKLQSIVQKYTTHSISSTLNLPEDSNWRETLDIYKTAYAEDLKGVTIFRNGSKQGVLGDSDNSSDNEGRGNEITYHDAPERPDKLNADLYHVRGQYVIAVGLLNDKPYEVFVLETSREQDYDEHFQIYKRGSRTYNLISTDSAQYIENILQYSPSSDADVLTRFTSQLMRHGVKMDYIVEQVRKADISINDFSNILAGVLEQYTSEEYTLTCENCGSENIKYVEGCATCQDCGASKCS
jgi:ribonucleoside-diphosphate reductase alpha chain